MWVLFAPDAGTGSLWQTLEENEFFELQAYKPATAAKNETSLLSMLTALPSSLLATSRAPSLIGGGTEETFPYRILLKEQPPYGLRQAAKQGKESRDSGAMEALLASVDSSSGSRSPAQVIALAKDLRAIKEHWNWLVNDMSTACSFFTRESEKEENELWDFLLVKFTSMAQQEAKKREMQRERERERAVERERQLEIASFVDNKPKYMKKQANIMITEEDEEDNRAKEKRFEEMDVGRQALWKKLFPKISTIERLIVEYPCSLERKGVERRGLLLVTPRHVCFHSPRLNTRVAIYWRVITSLSRATAVNGTVPAIYVTCLGAYHEEFLFHSLADFEQTMSVLVRIWHMALLEEAADRDGDEDAKARLMSVTREQILCEIEREKYRKSFRMPKDEHLIAEFCGSLWMENVIQVYEGTLHLSANYVCFYADVEGHSFSVVIPFREVLDIISVDSKLIQVNTHSNKFSFSLLWRRQHCCELMVQLWSRRVRSAERLLEKVPPAEGPWEDFNFVGLGPIAKDHKHFRSDYAIKQKLQRRRWEEYIAKYGWGIQMLKASDVLRDIVHFGIPDELKGGLWQIFLGSIHSLCIKPGEYHNLLKQFDGKNSDAVSEIERDVNRSLPEHPYFQSEKGKQALRNVLTAYSWRNPSLGYCQSMNIICSLLLLFMGEEEAFWALTILCEELFPHYFTPDMLGSMTDQHVLEDLVAEHFPKLNAHLESIQLPLVLISFPWFMCLFIGYIPMQTSIRILDILFCEGFDSTFIFKVALAVFKFNQKFILNTRDFSKLVIQLKFTSLDCDTLLEITEDFWWVTSKLINEMRDYHRFQLLKESKTPVPPINASPGGSGSTPLSARSTSAPTHFPRAPSTPVQTPTPTPSSSPPLPSYMTMPIRTRSDSSLFATGTKSPLGMSLPDGGTGSLTTIPFLPSADSVVAPTSGLAAGNGSLPSGGGQSGLLMSAPAGYHVAKTPSPSATPRKVQFDGTTIPFVGVASNDKIISALTRLSSKEHLTRRDEDSSTDATTEDDSSSDIDESSDSSTSSDDDSDSGIDESDAISSSEVSESEPRTRATSVTDEAGSDKASSPGQEDDEGRGSSGRRRKPRRDQEGEREQLFHLELETAKPDADAAKQPQTQQITPRSSNDELHSGSPRTPNAGGLAGAVVAAAAGAAAADGSSTPPSEGGRTAISKSEPSTPLRTAHSDDVLASSTIDPDKEKRRKRKLKSRRRRLASLGRTRSRKSRERIGRVKSGRTGEGSEDLFEPDPEADEREKRIVRLDLDLNLAWRKSPDDRAAVASGGADGANKGVKYLQRFLFKKRRRHSDGYLDIIKEDESLASPRGRTGDDPEPLTTHRRFFVEEDEGEERETTAGELEAPDSARREKGKEKEMSGNVERRRSQTDAVFSPRYGQRPSDDALLRVTSTSSPPVPANLTPRGGSSSTSSSSSSSTSSSTSEGAGLQRPAAQRQQQQSDSHDGERKDQSPPPSQQQQQQNQGKGKEKDEETDEDSSSETDESERDDELKSSVFVTSTTTVHPRVRKTKKVRERRASVANLLRKEPSGRLLDHVERKRTDQLLEDEFLIRAAGASAAAAGKRSDELASIASSKSQHDPQAQNQAPSQANTPAASVAATVMPTAALTPVKATPTPTPGGRSPPAGFINHKLIDELREDTASSADEDSGSDLDPREHGASPEGGRRKKIRSKLRHSRRLSISDPNLATSPPTRIGHRSRSNSKSGVAGGQAVVHPQSTSDDGSAAPAGASRSADDDEEQEEWERASSDGSERRGHHRQRSNSSNTSSSDDDDEGRTGGGSDGEGGSSMSANGGNGSESGGSRRRAKAILFKYSADILAKTKAAEQRRREERRDKDRTREEEKEKRKRERLDEKEARRRNKEEHKERRRLVAVSAPEREKEDESAEKKRRHKEEKELKRRKEEEEKESRRKRKEEEKEMKKLHKLEKKASSSSTTSLHSAALGGGGGGGGATVEFAIDEREGSEKDKEREKHKKAFGLLPLPHLSHHHSLSFHLPSSPRRGAIITSPTTTAASSSTTSTTPPIPATSSSSSLYSSSTATPSSSSSSSSSLLKTPPSPRAHVAPITFNRTTPHPHAVSADPPPESPRKLPFASVGGVAASDVPLVASRTRLQTSDRSSP